MREGGSLALGNGNNCSAKKSAWACAPNLPLSYMVKVSTTCDPPWIAATRYNEKLSAKSGCVREGSAY